MKKFLLSLALVLGIGSAASAADVTLPENGTDWSAYTWTESNNVYSTTIKGYEFLLDVGTYSNAFTAPDAYSIRVYDGSTLTINAPEGTTIKTIYITTNSNTKGPSIAASEGWTVVEKKVNNKNLLTSAVITAETPLSSITITGDGKQIRIATIKFSSEAPTTGGETGGETVGDTPSTGIANTQETAYTVSEALNILAAGQDLDTEVYIKGEIKSIKEVNTTQYYNATYTITDGTNDLEVFRGKYLDGAGFSSEDQITVGMNVIIYGKLTTYNSKAQVNSGSKIVKIEGAAPVETTNVANIAEYLTKNVGDKVKFTSPVNAIYQNGNYLYVQDNTGNALVYGKLTNKYENGMAIAAGFEGSVAEFNSLKQLNPVDSTFAAGVAGTAIAPEAYAIEEISADIAHSYVSFEGVSIAAVEGNERNFTMTDETGSIVLYQQWTDIEIPVGENLNVVGFVGAYKGNAQILAVSITSASGKEIVAVPTFTPDGGAVLAGTEVTIASATEGATIYYTTDGTEPTTASTVYTEAIVVNEALTLKAIAAKEGMENSTVATAEFTIKEPAVVSGNTATFNFTDPSTLDPAYSLADSEPDGSNGNNKIDLENGVLFTANGITISTVASGNPTRLYCQKPDTDKTWSFRFFRNSVVTISCQQGYKLTSIEFEPQTTNYANVLAQNIKFSVGTLADNVLTFDADTTVTSVDLTNPSKNDGGNTCGLNTITVTFSELSGISDVEINENAPVEFFNLQGVRVNGDLTPGLYIRRQGNNATKVIVK